MPETTPPVQQSLLTDPPPADPKPPQGEAPAATPPEKKEPPKETPEAPAETLLTGDGEPPKEPPKGTEAPGKPLDLKPPVGVNSDDPGFVKFKQFAAEKKLTQEQAQNALDLMHSQYAEEAKKVKAAFTAMKAEWAKLSQADAEIGGDRMASSLSNAKRAIDKYGTQGLRDALKSSGLGNHPEVVRFFARVGKSLGEDSFAPGTASAPTPKQTEEDRLRRMYPSMFPKEQ